MDFKFELGDLAQDEITGFRGVIVARTQWLNNCNVYRLQSPDLKDGKPVIVAGSPGGSRIPEYVSKSLVLMLAFGQDPSAAAAWSNISHRNGDSLVVEPGFDADIALVLDGAVRLDVALDVVGVEGV